MRDFSLLSFAIGFGIPIVVYSAGYLAVRVLEFFCPLFSWKDE